MKNSSFKNISPVILGLGALSLVIVMIAVIATITRPTDKIVIVDGTPMKSVRIEPIPGSPRILEPIAGSNGGSPTNKLACEDAGGTWNDCGSACRNKPDTEICAEVCVEYCECSSDRQCPNDENNVNRLKCTEYINGIGVCK